MKLLFVSLIFSYGLFASETSLEIRPKSPVVGETFQLVFKVKTQSDSTPIIDFEAKGLDIIGKQNLGVSIKTIVINGRLSTTREVSYAYSVVANEVKTYSVRNIKVKIDGRTSVISNKRFRVLKEPLKSPDLFLVAEVDKETVYLGEGLEVIYYLYSKSIVSGSETQKFPKFQNFIKRFFNTNSRRETVEYQGQVYNRNIVYRAYLFPGKVGELTIDPMKMRVQYSKSLKGSLFSFGFNSGRLQTKNLSSKPVKILVKPLPAANVPPHFTGLVGDHSFSLKRSRDKFLINEPVEVRLEVSGPGLLENYDGPELYTHPEIESFDKKSEIFLNPNNTGKKVFDYTYLGRGEVTIPGQEIKLAYFDPATSSYKTKVLNLEGIEIKGGNIGQTTPKQVVPKVGPGIKVPNVVEGLIAPEFEVNARNKIDFNLINLGLKISFFLVFFLSLVKFLISKRRRSSLTPLIKRIKKEGLRYSLVHQAIHHGLAKPETNASLGEIIKNSSLGPQAKKYFTELVERLQKQDYHEGMKVKHSFKAKFFRELEEKSLQS